MRLRRITRHLQKTVHLRLVGVLLILAGITAAFLVRAMPSRAGENATESPQPESPESQQIEELQLHLELLRHQWKAGSFANTSRHDSLSKRGIVTCAGGVKLLANTYVNVHVLRNVLNSTLPIEIYHNGKADAPKEAVAAFKGFKNVTFVDLATLPAPNNGSKPANMHGYVQKVLSLYSTKFAEVLLLDADSQPLINPGTLFDTPAYQKNGNLFWSDFWPSGVPESPDEEVYRWLGLDPPWKDVSDWRSAESGQVLFDRARHADVLEWLWFLNSHADLLYKHMLGDKDTFEMAFMLAGKHKLYARVSHGPGLPTTALRPYDEPSIFTRIFRPNAYKEDARYLRQAMLQFDPQGRPAFWHRTGAIKFGEEHGLSLDAMRPAFWIPPFSPQKAQEIQPHLRNMQSFPPWLVDANCSCCVLDAGVAALIEQLGRRVPAHTEGEVCADMVPLFPVSWLGPQAQAALDGGFAGFKQYASKVHGVSLRGL